LSKSTSCTPRSAKPGSPASSCRRYPSKRCERSKATLANPPWRISRPQWSGRSPLGTRRKFRGPTSSSEKLHHTSAHGSKGRVRYHWREQTSRSLKAALLLCRFSTTNLCQSLSDPSLLALSPALSIWHMRLLIMSCWARSQIPRADSVSPLASKSL